MFSLATSRGALESWQAAKGAPSRQFELLALLASDCSDFSMAPLLLVVHITDWPRANVITCAKLKGANHSVYTSGQSRPSARRDAKAEHVSALVS